MRKILLIMFVVSVVMLIGCEKTTPTTCPSIDTSKITPPVKVDEVYKVDISKVTYGDNYKLAPSEKQNSPFFDNTVSCNKGKEAGQNINNIYCEQFMIQKLITNENGDITEEINLGVSFVFDKDNKFIEAKCYK